MNVYTRAFAAAALALGSLSAQASVIYSQWTGNAAPDGNYILTVDHVADKFNYNLTVNPWNAEALALFIDFGSVNLADPVLITNASPVGQIALFAKDTSSDDCGSGCNLNGLSVPLAGDGQWELVFRLGAAGFDGIQTFSWTTQDFGLNENAIGVVAIRGQSLCASGTLPNSDCSLGDKVYGFVDKANTPTNTPSSVPEPGTALLVGVGLAVAARARRSLTLKAE